MKLQFHGVRFGKKSLPALLKGIVMYHTLRIKAHLLITLPGNTFTKTRMNIDKWLFYIFHYANEITYGNRHLYYVTQDETQLTCEYELPC